MPRLPVPGSDDDVWGDLLNEFLEVEHNADGTQKTVGVTKGGTGRTTGGTAYGVVATGTTADGAQQTITPGSSGQLLKSNGASALPSFQDGAAADVGLGNVDNTSDLDKPVSTATQTALDAKVAKAGDTMSGNLDMGTSMVTNLGTTTNDADAATKSYVDTTANTLLASSQLTGSVGYRVENLDNWYTALESAKTTPVDIVVVGDSISVLGGDRNTWPNILVSLFGREGAKATDSGGIEFTRTSTAIPNMDSCQGTDTTTGLAGYARELTDGQTANTNKPMDAVTIIYTQQSTGGQIEVRDGGSGGTLLTTIDTSGTQKSSQMWTSADLGYATHDIHLTAVCGAGETVILEGVYVHCGTRDRGVRVFSATRSGAKSSDFETTASWGLDLIETLQPDLVIIATGTNDSADAGGYAGNVPDLVTAIQGVVTCDIALWVPYINSQFTEAEAASGRSMASTYSLGLIDASRALGDYSASGDPDNIYSADNIHPDTTLRYMQAWHVYSVLNGDPFGKSYVDQALIENRLTTVEDSLNPSTQSWVQASGSFVIGTFFGYPTFDLKQNSNIYFSVTNPYINGLLGGNASSAINFGDGTTAQPDTQIARDSASVVSISLGAGELKYARAITTNTATSYTLVATDQNKNIECNNASAQTVTVPPNSSVAFPTGSVIYVTQYGAGQVTVAPGSGVTLRSYGSVLSTTGQYASLMLHKRATDEWIVTTLPSPDPDANAVPKASIITESGSSRTIATADAWDYIRLTNATSCNVTVPDNVDDAIPVGTQIYLRSAGAGTYTIVEDTAVTVNPPSGGTLVLDGDAALIKVATDEWDLVGATVAA